MKFGFVDEHRKVWPVRVMCAVLGLSASGYYAWRVRPESPRAAANRALLDDIRLIQAESSGTYGSPRVHAILRGHGRGVGRSRIERPVRRAGIRGLAALPRRARTTDSRHGYPIAPNRLARNLTAQAPNQIRHHPLDEPQGRLLGQHPDAELLPHPQDRARPPPGLRHPRPGPARSVPIHRGLLQSPPTALSPRLHHPSRRRAQSGLTPSTFSGENQVFAPPPPWTQLRR